MSGRWLLMTWSQMKAKPVKQMFIDLGIEQTFARRRTPNDNPYVESLFGTIKTSPVYPGWFPYDDEAVVHRYFERTSSGIIVNTIIHGSAMSHRFRSIPVRLSGL